MSRHTRSFHPQHVVTSERDDFISCPIEDCSSSEKRWPRLDNFRSHLRRVHGDLLKTKADIQATIALAATKLKPLANDEDSSTVFQKRSSNTLKSGRHLSLITKGKLVNRQEHVVQPLAATQSVVRQKGIGVGERHTTRRGSDKDDNKNILSALAGPSEHTVLGTEDDHSDTISSMFQETNHTSDALANLSASYLFQNDAQVFRRHDAQAINVLSVVDHGLLQGLTNIVEDSVLSFTSQDLSLTCFDGADVDEFLDLGIPSPDIVGTLQMLDSTIALCEQRNRISGYQKARVEQTQPNATEEFAKSLTCEMELLDQEISNNMKEQGQNSPSKINSDLLQDHRILRRDLGTRTSSRNYSEHTDCDLDGMSNHITNRNDHRISGLDMQTASAKLPTTRKSMKRRAVDAADLGSAKKVSRRSRFS